MKDLKSALNEAFNTSFNTVTESIKFKESDLDKVAKVIDNPSKIKKFIKDHDDEIKNMGGLSNSDIDDIISIMSDFNSGLTFAMDMGSDNVEEYLEDPRANLEDDHEEDWLDTAIDWYKELFKEVTGKDLE